MGYALNKSELLAGEVMEKSRKARELKRQFIVGESSEATFKAYEQGCIDLEDILDSEDIEILEHLIKQVWEG